MTPIVKLEAILADDTPAETPEIDVDALDDKAFADLKGQMRAEQPVKAEEATKPATEAAADPDKEPNEVTDPADPNFRKEVPHGQWHRERERRKEAEAERQKIAENYQKLLDRTTQLLQAPPPAALQEEAAADEPPDPDVDPQGAIRWMQKYTLDQRKLAADQQAQYRQQAEQQQAFKQVFDKVNGDFTAATKADPTVTEAHMAIRESLANELLAMGYSQQEAAQQIVNTENQHLVYIAQNGLNVGDYLKNLAKARGWQPKPAPANDAGLSEAEKIVKREETRLASQSLGKAGGAVVNTGTISPQELLDMSDADFEAYKKKHGSVAHAFRQAS